MTTVGFVRHGVTAWNKAGRAQGSSDIALDNEGIQMAESLSERLANEQWDVIYSSPLIRAKKTAEIISKRKPLLELFFDDRIRETGGGQIEGTTLDERIARWGESWRELDLGFELNDDVVTRGMSFIEEIKIKHPGQKVLVVSHGSFIRRLVEFLIPDKELNKKIDNTSVTIIELNETENHCKLYNCVVHLKD